MSVEISNLAKKAFTFASRERTLPGDMLADAEYYVERGVAALKNSSTWDPDVDATDAAEDALVTYAKNRLLGRPGEDGEFAAHVKAWMVAATKAANKKLEADRAAADSDYSSRLYDYEA